MIEYRSDNSKVTGKSDQCCLKTRGTLDKEFDTHIAFNDDVHLNKKPKYINKALVL